MQIASAVSFDAHVFRNLGPAAFSLSPSLTPKKTTKQKFVDTATTSVALEIVWTCMCMFFIIIGHFWNIFYELFRSPIISQVQFLSIITPTSRCFDSPGISSNSMLFDTTKVVVSNYTIDPPLLLYLNAALVIQCMLDVLCSIFTFDEKMKCLPF